MNKHMNAIMIIIKAELGKEKRGSRRQMKQTGEQGLPVTDPYMAFLQVLTHPEVS